MNAPLAKEQMALLMSDSLTMRDTYAPGTERTVAEQRPSGARRIVTLCRNAMTALIEMPRRRAVLNELSVLTDRELADIGLSRAELGRVFDPAFAKSRRRDATIGRTA